MNEILDEIMEKRIEAAEDRKEAEGKEDMEKTAVCFLKMGLTPEQVAEGTRFTLEEVKRLNEEMTA